MDMLKDDVLVKALIRYMNEKGQQKKSEEVACLVSHMDIMGKQHDFFMSDIKEMKWHLACAIEQYAPVKSSCNKMAIAVGECARTLHYYLFKNREHIASCAKTAVAEFDQRRISGLNQAVFTLCSYGPLETTKDKMSEAADDIGNLIHNIEAMIQELRTPNSHLRNAGHGTYDKEQIEECAKYLRESQEFLQSAGSTLYCVNREIGAMMETVHRLELLNKKAERPSVRCRLVSEAPAHALPGPAKRPHEVDR
ncbi:MAG: hypothetical protein K2N78_03935 [Oscillospiraceae bacterium]|nr:hypothetical protein [Oscillospiraceae bacterium]